MTEPITHFMQNHVVKIFSLLLLVISILVLIYSCFAIIGGVYATTLFIFSAVILTVFLMHKIPAKIIALTTVLNILAIAISGLGLIVQMKNVQSNCEQYTDPGSTEHVACFQENYSPWRGLIQSI